MNETLWIAHALTPEGWHDNVSLSIQAGRIASIAVGTDPGAATRHAIALPGMPNLHGHAFQRGMAGLTEKAGPTVDSFWTWRQVMYRFTNTLTPEDVRIIATLLYVELLEAGFTRIGEFHYLHHDHDGQPYADLAEMAGQIVAAADESGIGLTLLPVLYQAAGFGGEAPAAGQRRFVCTMDRFARLLEASAARVAMLEGGVVGVAPHSLRAVTPQALLHCASLSRSGPVHLHIAEQRREVEECLAWCGARPVDWLLANAPVDATWCLVHATHVEPDEIDGIARRGAVVGLCPATEANLGDGIFPAVAFRDAGGRFGIGSDSHVSVGVADELRLLEYSQRLRLGARNVLADPGGSTGRALFDAAVRGGARALGAGPHGLEEGAWADIVTLDAAHPTLAARSGDQWLDGWIFAAGNTAIDCVWARGRLVVERGRHRLREAVRERYVGTMQRLLA